MRTSKDSELQRLTVTAQPFDSAMVIRGTVVDISAGTQQQAQAANFPYGVPAVSDSSMTPFMEAVYMQQPMPTNTTGVPVTISVLDSNGNYRQIGTTTSDGSGTFKPILDMDRALKVDLKKKVRGIRTVEKKLQLETTTRQG